MGYGVSMLIKSLLLPVIMVIIGSIYVKKVPEEINKQSDYEKYGYRTPMSMKNKDTWEFANHYLGKIWRAAGLVLLVLSFAAMVLVYNWNARDVHSFSTKILAVQVIVLILSLIPPEVALRKNFDKNGNRK